MTITPAIKGQITKAIGEPLTSDLMGNRRPVDNARRIAVITRVFAKHMPREQAKHAAKRYIMVQWLRG